MLGLGSLGCGVIPVQFPDQAHSAGLSEALLITNNSRARARRSERSSMPSLPIQQIQARGLVPEISADVGTGGPATAVAQGVASMALGVNNWIQQERDAEDNLAMTNAMSRLRAGMTEDMADQVGGAEGGEKVDGPAEGKADRIKANFQRRIDAEYKRMSPRAARKFDAQYAGGLRAQVQAQAFNAERGAKQEQMRSDAAQGAIADGQAVFADPSQAVDIMARRAASTDSLPLPEVERQAMKLRQLQAIAQSAINAMVDRDPAGTAKRLNEATPESIKSDPVLSALPADRLELAKHRANTEVSRIAAEGRFDIASRTKDVQTMVMNGVTPPANVAPTVDEYKRIHGASGQAIWQQEVGDYLQIGGAIQRMRTASAPEREEILQANRPTAGAGFSSGMRMYQALGEAKSIVERDIVKDPAAYALGNSPRVRNAAAVMQQVMEDPKKGAEDRVAVTKFFAEVMQAEQLRLGIATIRDDLTGNKPRGPRLLTNAQANAISDELSDPATGGVNAARLIQQLEQRWAESWPMVYRQLAADNKLPPAALVIPNMPNDASRSRMAAVSVMKPDELKALVAPGDMQDIQDRVRSEFDQAQRTFTAQGASGGATLSVIMGEAEKLAYWYRSTGRSVKEAARQAYTETMGHAYTFTDTYRVPSRFDGGQVQRGADATVEKVLREGGARVFAGEASHLLTDDAIRYRSMWITSSDESGLELRLRGADGGVYAILSKDGQPVRMTWADLLTNANEAKARDQTQEGNEEWLRRRQRELNPRR